MSGPPVFLSAGVPFVCVNMISRSYPSPPFFLQDVYGVLEIQHRAYLKRCHGEHVPFVFDLERSLFLLGNTQIPMVPTSQITSACVSPFSHEDGLISCGSCGEAIFVGVGVGLGVEATGRCLGVCAPKRKDPGKILH